MRRSLPALSAVAIGLGILSVQPANFGLPGLLAGAGFSRAEEIKASPDESVAAKLPTPFGQGAVVSAIHEYMDARLGRAAQDRRAYWDGLRQANGALDYARARADLRSLLGMPNDCWPPRAGRLITQTPVASLEEGRIERWTMKVCSGLIMTGLVGYPKGNAGTPLVIAMHGTSATPESVFGIEDKADIEVIDYHHSFGRRLMSRGLIVFAPLLITETRADPREGFNKTRNEINRRGLPMGLSVNGIQIGMLSAALDILLESSAADSSRVGVYGISHGGQLGFYFAAIESRVRAAVISQWFEDRAKKLSGSAHPHALYRYHDAQHNFYNKMLLYFTDIDVARLIAPRGLFVEAGRKDGPRAKSAAANFQKLAKIYQEVGSQAGTVCIEVAADAGHEIIMNKSLQFLEYWLLDRKIVPQEFCPTEAEP